MQSDISKIIDKFADESRDVLKDNVVVEYLFGSYATKTHTPLSDIDILIIVRNLTPVIQSLMDEMASDYSLKYDFCISPILTDIREFTKNNTPILPVFLPVFCVAITKEYSNIPSLSRLEYEQKSYVI
jgi:predicted nucleotidyltransferase